MKEKSIETFVGLIVIVITISFFSYAYSKVNTKSSDKGYSLYVQFEDIEGLSEGSDVKLSGIKIGTVNRIHLENSTYYAKVELTIYSDIQIPKDSRAIVATSGIMGGKYIRITPGSSEKMLANSGKIVFSQSAINLEDLVSKIVYSLTGSKE